MNKQPETQTDGSNDGDDGFVVIAEGAEWGLIDNGEYDNQVTGVEIEADDCKEIQKNYSRDIDWFLTGIRLRIIITYVFERLAENRGGYTLSWAAQDQKVIGMNEHDTTITSSELIDLQEEATQEVINLFKEGKIEPVFEIENRNDIYFDGRGY